MGKTMGFLSNIGLLISLLCISLLHTSLDENTYAEKAEKHFEPYLLDRNKSYRWIAFNLLKHLSDDEEEHLNADEKDPIVELTARVKKGLIGVIKNHRFLGNFKDREDPKLLEALKDFTEGRNYVAKNVFNDSRLDKLWDKVEMSGFTNEELQTLKEHFQHCKDEMTEYWNCRKVVEDDITEFVDSLFKEKGSNEIKKEETSSNGSEPIEYLKKATMIVEQNSAKFQNSFSKEFIDPKVRELWFMASRSNFEGGELVILKEELLRFEAKIA